MGFFDILLFSKLTADLAGGLRIFSNRLIFGEIANV